MPHAQAPTFPLHTSPCPQVSARTLADHPRALLCGDFNFDSQRNFSGTGPLENNCLEAVLPDFVDVWPLLRPADRGFTFDSERNPVIHKPERMRYDRVCVRKATPLDPDPNHPIPSDCSGSDHESALSPSSEPGPRRSSTATNSDSDPVPPANPPSEATPSLIPRSIKLLGTETLDHPVYNLKPEPPPAPAPPPKKVQVARNLQINALQEGTALDPPRAGLCPSDHFGLLAVFTVA